MKLSGIVEIQKQAKQSPDGKAIKIAARSNSQKGDYIWYVLHSTNNKVFPTLESLSVGDIIHFSGATLIEVRSFIGRNGEPSTMLEVSLNYSEVSCQRREASYQSQGVSREARVNNSQVEQAVDHSPQEKIKSENNEEDYSFDQEKKSELNILSENWEGTPFDL